MLLLLGILSGGGLVAFLVTLLIIAIVIYALKLLLDYVPIPQPIKLFMWLIIAVIIIIYLLQRFAGISL